jgi:hypothetical protein
LIIISVNYKLVLTIAKCIALPNIPPPILTSAPDSINNLAASNYDSLSAKQSDEQSSLSKIFKSALAFISAFITPRSPFIDAL